MDWPPQIPDLNIIYNLSLDNAIEVPMGTPGG